MMDWRSSVWIEDGQRLERELRLGPDHAGPTDVSA
jgi:hypothetical protein